VKLYHRTPAGDAILAEGFRNGRGHYLTSNIYEGVWLSNMPLSAASGAPGDDVLVVEMPEEVIAEFEWVDETNGEYREWLVPADIVNRFPVERCDEDEADDSEWEPDEAAIEAIRQRLGQTKIPFTE
jgi:hypothetical protein